jgi:hypothetical protein
MITAVRSLLLLFAFACTANAADAVRDRSQTDEIIYFVLPDRFENGNLANDRGGLPGDRLQHGFDPTSKAFFHGGDLQGLTARLDYIQALGATAVWLTPVFKNKAVQGARARNRPVITVTGSRISPPSIRISAMRRRCRLSCEPRTRAA